MRGAINYDDATPNEAWNYDAAAGSVIYHNGSTYTYPAATAPHPHAPLTAGTKSYTYDANGNTLTDGTRTFTYDGENRPATVQNGPTSVQYVYGPDGERVKKIANGVTTAYFGNEFELSGGTWTKYLGPAKRVAALTTWLHGDHLGTIRLITNAAGAQAERANYSAYGVQSPGLSQSKGYIGEKFDPETGLQYLHARFYNPAIGRFLTPDTFNPADPGVGTNRYAYSFDDPINGNCSPPFEAQCDGLTRGWGLDLV